MSSALSNLSTAFSVSLLASSHRSRPLLGHGLCSVKAMGGEARVGREAKGNLDRLQRESKHQVTQQQQPKKRIAQSAPLGLWGRFPTARTIQQMMDTMDSIMEDPFAYSTERAALPLLSSEDAGLGSSSYRRGRTPWEIKEKEGEYKLRFDMPGMTKKDVKVRVEEKMLVIKAEKLLKEGDAEHEEEEEWSARSYGKYNSTIALPENVEAEKIKAEVKDGVLYVTIPKAQASSKILSIDMQ